MSTVKSKTKDRLMEAHAPNVESNQHLLDQLIETWRTNNKMQLLLVDSISDEGMDATLSTRGGRTVYLQLVHVHNVRIGWLEQFSKELFKKHSPLDKGKPFDRKLLHKAFEDSGKAVEELIILASQNSFQLKGFKSGLMPFLGYLLTHDAHHRGHILLTLKQTGNRIPDSVKWALWEWNK